MCADTCRMCGQEPGHPPGPGIGQRPPATLQARPEGEAGQHRPGQEDQQQPPGLCKSPPLYMVSSTESCSNLADILCLCTQM